MKKTQPKKIKKPSCPTPLKVGSSNFTIYQRNILAHIQAEKFRNRMLEKDNDNENY
jgi:hypothetical protein